MSTMTSQHIIQSTIFRRRFLFQKTKVSFDQNFLKIFSLEIDRYIGNKKEDFIKEFLKRNDL